MTNTERHRQGQRFAIAYPNPGLPKTQLVGIRSVAFGLCLMATSFAPAQTTFTAARTYEAVIGSLTAEPATKSVIAAVHHEFPQAITNFLKEPTHVLIEHPDALDERKLKRALEEAGLTLLSFGQVDPKMPIIIPGMEDFPSYVDTGDPGTDAANYANAKAAWIAEHPEAYQLLLNSATRDGPGSK